MVLEPNKPEELLWGAWGQMPAWPGGPAGCRFQAGSGGLTDAASQNSRSSKSWAMGAVDAAAVLCQAPGEVDSSKGINSSRIPEPPWLLVLLKEWMDDETVLSQATGQSAPTSWPFLSSL